MPQHPAPTVAGVEVIPLCDAVGPMGPALAKPLPELSGGPEQTVWAHPGAVDPTQPWILHFHCHLVRDRRDRLILVDTGLGGVHSPAAAWAPVPGRLSTELAAVGVAPAEVDAVVITHLQCGSRTGSW